MTLRTLSLAGLAALSVSVSQPAAAAVMQAVYTGTLFSGSDQTGLFGTANADLTGAAVTMTFVYDTALGTRATNADPTYSDDQVYGGTVWANTSPMISDSVTVNGHTVSNAVGYQDYTYAQEAPGSYHYNQHYGSLYSSDATSYTSNYLSAYFYGASLGGVADLTQPLSQDVDANGSHAYFQLFTYDYGLQVDTTDTYGNFYPGHLTITALSAVPLPATGILLLAGIGGLGALARRRRAG